MKTFEIKITRIIQEYSDYFYKVTAKTPEQALRKARQDVVEASHTKEYDLNRVKNIAYEIKEIKE